MTVSDRWNLLIASRFRDTMQVEVPVSYHVASASKCLKSVGELGKDPVFWSYVASTFEKKLE